MQIRADSWLVFRNNSGEVCGPVPTPQFYCKYLHLQEVNRPESSNHYTTAKYRRPAGACSDISPPSAPSHCGEEPVGGLWITHTPEFPHIRCGPVLVAGAMQMQMMGRVAQVPTMLRQYGISCILAGFPQSNLPLLAGIVPVSPGRMAQMVRLMRLLDE